MIIRGRWRGRGLGDVAVPPHDPANVYTAEDARRQAQWTADVAKMKPAPMSKEAKARIGLALAVAAFLYWRRRDFFGRKVR
jgi:hypothetical protein